MDNSYSKKLREEISRYKDVVNIHELPEIFYYWSNKYLAPIYKSYGFQNIRSIYVHYMKEACRRNAGKTMRFVSIGAGNCQLEVTMAHKLLSSGKKNFMFECLDINANMLERGAQRATEKGVEDFMEFKAVDLNHWEASCEYHVVLALQCLHHFVELETIFGKIYDCLSPNGYFITHDMVGRNGHLRWPETLDIVNHFWQQLPEKYKYNHQLHRLEREFLDWDCSMEGFEGIRSQDILPLLVNKFHFSFFIFWGGAIDVFIDRSFGPNFNPNSEFDRQLIDQVQAMDFENTMAGLTKPTQIIAAMSKHDIGLKEYWYGKSPESCIRYPS